MGAADTVGDPPAGEPVGPSTLLHAEGHPRILPRSTVERNATDYCSDVQGDTSARACPANTWIAGPIMTPHVDLLSILFCQIVFPVVF